MADEALMIRGDESDAHLRCRHSGIQRLCQIGQLTRHPGQNAAAATDNQGALRGFQAGNGLVNRSSVRRGRSWQGESSRVKGGNGECHPLHQNIRRNVEVDRPRAPY